MTEFRKDPIVGQWVIVRQDGSFKPEDYSKEDHAFRQQATCQFCPGKEYFTPPEIEAVRYDGSSANKPGWQVRVVPNKFPALKIEGDIDRRKLGIFDMSNGVGAHEVVIETPSHEKQLADLGEQDIVDVINKYQSRVVDLTRDRRFKYIIIFKNYGAWAGASVEHAHSQIIALPMIPKYVLEELQGAEKFFAAHQQCVFCAMIEQEIREQERLVAENGDYLAFCPFVSRYPFECWILPKKHGSPFASISGHERLSLAQLLKDCLMRIKGCLSDPSYNFYLHTSPVNYEEEESYHWHLEIVPRLTQFSGFEWGSGYYVVRTSPEDAAKYLREILVSAKTG